MRIDNNLYKNKTLFIMGYWKDLLSVARESVEELNKDINMDEFLDKMLLITMLLSTSLTHAKDEDKEKCREEIGEIFSRFLETKAAKNFLFKNK